MVELWYCVEHKGKNEIGFYNQEGKLTDFNRGTLLAYGKCCLVAGFKTKQQAEEGLKLYPCKDVSP